MMTAIQDDSELLAVWSSSLITVVATIMIGYSGKVSGGRLSAELADLAEPGSNTAR
jgi:ABC-type cobalamin transport system permease subunit